MPTQKKVNTKHCPVNAPAHYTKGGVDTWDFIAIKELDFFEGNIVKYVVRWREKGGVQDLEKALAYLKKMIEMA